jgi:endoglucanase
MTNLKTALLPLASFAAAFATAAVAVTVLQPQVPQTPSAPMPMELVGVNLASGEFAPEKLPGTWGTDYIYPGRETAAPFVAAGLNVVRLPVLWERLQPTPGGPLDFQELKRLDQSIADLAAFKLIIVDLHNYGRYRGALLDEERGAAMLADFWTRLGKHYGSSPAIAFGLMNEPHGIEARRWRRIMDTVVGTIRAAGARNLLLVPGTRWTGAHSWSSGPDSNASAFAGFRDPANNFLFEVHQYLDGDSSGRSAECVDQTVGSRRMEQFTRWARKEKARAFLAEFGGGTDATCLAALDELLAFMSRNTDVWAGGAYWAGGDWWGDYPLSIQPDPRQAAKPQLRVLMRYAPALRQPE